MLLIMSLMKTHTLSLNSAHISMPFSSRESIAMEMPGTAALFADFPPEQLKLYNFRLYKFSFP